MIVLDIGGLTIAGFITLACTCIGMYLNVRSSVKADKMDAVNEREQRTEMKIMLKSMKESLDKALVKLDKNDADINALKIEQGILRELLKSHSERLERLENEKS